MIKITVSRFLEFIVLSVLNIKLIRISLRIVNNIYKNIGLYYIFIYWIYYIIRIVIYLLLSVLKKMFFLRYIIQSLQLDH